EEALNALSLSSDLVRSQNRGAFRFVHGLVRETIYDALPVRTRLQLHARVVTALEARRAVHGNAILSALAHHALRGHPEVDPGRALGYARRAGERALGLLAYEDAALYFDEALALLDRSD